MKDVKVAKTNYQFEKRRKEIRKKKKAEEKRQRKLDKSSPLPPDGSPEQVPVDVVEEKKP